MSPFSFRAMSRWVRHSLLRRATCRAPLRSPLRFQPLEDRAVPAAMVGLDSANFELVFFDSQTPGSTTSKAITGLGVGEPIVGIDYRPSDGQLYGVTVDGAGTGRLYRLDATSGAATKVSTLVANPSDAANPFTVIAGSGFSVDFDPQFDVLRIVTDIGENLQVIPDASGFVTTDDNINGAAFGLTGIAYTNNFKGAQSTVLYGISGTADQLYQFASPSGGQTSKVGSELGADPDDNVGFDISGKNAFATLNQPGGTSLFTVNLTSGVATSLGAVGSSAIILSDVAIVLDVTAPTVSSIITLDTNPTSTNSVRFLVTFSENVSGVDATAFSIVESGGVSGAKIASVNYDPVNNNARITVDSFTGSGSIGLNLVDIDTIFDDAGIPLGGVGNGNGDKTGQVYTVTAATGPTVVISQAGGQNDPTTTLPIRFNVTFSKAVVGFDTADISVGGGTGAAVASVTSTDSTTFEVTLNGATSGGVLTISFPAGAAQDASTNEDSQAPTGDNSVEIIGNQPPTITAPTATLNVNEDTDLSFTGGTLITITDPDLGSQNIRVTITAPNGTFTLSQTTGLTFNTGANGTSSMSITGTLSDVTNALANGRFKGALNFNGATTLRVDADDLGNTGIGGAKTATKTVNITVDAVNDGPSITAPASINATKDTAFTFSGANVVSITDVDAGTGLIRITLAVSQGKLTLANKSGLSITVGDGTDDASITFTGNLTNTNNALNGLKYQPNTSFLGADNLAITVDDQGSTGSGGSATAAFNTSITVNVQGNRAPVAVNDTFTIKQNQTLTVSAPGIVQNDTDADNNILSADLITGIPATAGVLNFVGNGAFTFTPKTNFIGTVSFTYKASDGPSQSNTATVTITVTETFTRLFATGAEAGGGPHVIVHNEDGSVRVGFYAFDASFSGGVSVATGDVNGDGVEDIVVGAGAGGGSHVRVLSGVDLRELHSFMAFDGFAGGVNVAAGDVNGDGKADVIVAAGKGAGPHVKVFDGSNGNLMQSFMAFDTSFDGGVNVAAHDMNADGKADIITGAGPGAGPHVLVYGAMTSEVLRSFYAFDEAVNFGGARVAAGNFGSKAAIFAAAGPDETPIVNIVDFATGTSMTTFVAFGISDPAPEDAINSGVNIASNTASNGTTTLYLALGPNASPTVRIMDATSLNERSSFQAYDPSFLGGVFVG